MTVNSINIINNLPAHRTKIINILNFNSEKLSVIRNNNDKTNVYYDNNPFFLAIDGLKGYFEEHDDANSTIFGSKKDKYLTIIFTNEHQKLLYKEILKNINKNISRNYVKIKFESTDKLPLNILVNICTLILVVRYQRIYLTTCWYDQFYNGIQIKDTVR